MGLAKKPSRAKKPGLAQQFGLNIRRIRKDHGLSQEALAAGAGLAPTYVGQIERGKRSPTLDVVERLAEALGVKPSDLLQ
jgi:transcriptional regulator with XRE-family HTH domain